MIFHQVIYLPIRQAFIIQDVCTPIVPRDSPGDRQEINKILLLCRKKYMKRIFLSQGDFENKYGANTDYRVHGDGSGAIHAMLCIHLEQAHLSR
jgi:hypothetical protein